MPTIHVNKVLVAVTTAALFSLVVEGVLATWKIVSLQYEKEIIERSINDPITGFIARSLTCEMNIQELRNAMNSVSSDRRASINANNAKLQELIVAVRDLKSSSKVR